MQRFARWHPFLWLAGLTVVVPLLWNFSGLDYDQGGFGFALFAASYAITLPVSVLAPMAGFLAWPLVVALYILADRALATLTEPRAPEVP